MNGFRRLLHLWVGTLLGLSLRGLSAGPVPMVNVNPSTDVPQPYYGFDESHGDGMVGWTFCLLEPFTVTRVGWYDKDADGLSRAFQVGLWEGQGSEADPVTPQFPGLHYSSLIGDADTGLTIPGGTNASLAGVWRVVDLPEPLTLQPGSYQLGGVDTAQTTDVIEYVLAGPPGYCPFTPPGSPAAVGMFFFAYEGIPPGQAYLHPTTNYYLDWGLELGPMLFGTNSAPVTTGAGLSIRRFPLGFQGPDGNGVLLSWSTGTLVEADAPTGPYTPVTNGVSPFIVPSSTLKKFYRLSQ